MEGFDVFKRYSALRAHFNSPSYDLIKSKGKTRVTVASYNKRNDIYYFEKFGKKYEDSEITPMFISIFLQNPKIWVGDLNNHNHRAVYEEWRSRLSNLKERIKIDLNNLNRYLEVTNKELCDIINTQQIPTVYRLYLTDRIMPETLILLEAYFEISKDRDIEDPVWQKEYNHLMKYKRLIQRVSWKDYYDLIKTINNNHIENTNENRFKKTKE